MGAQRAISQTVEPGPAHVVRELRPCQLVTTDRADSGPPTEPPEEAIRLRSQQIWEQEGRPEGYADDHWARARAELAEQMAKTANAPRPEESVAQPAVFAEAQQAKLSGPGQQGLDGDVDKDLEAWSLENDAEAPEGDGFASARTWLLTPAKRSPRAVPSIICAGLVLRGVLDTPDELHFDGCMDGEVRSSRLDVGEEGRIRGEVIADELTVRGTIRGRICARRVLLCSGSRVEGEVLYGALIVEYGAQVDARFLRLDVPPEVTEG